MTSTLYSCVSPVRGWRGRRLEEVRRVRLRPHVGVRDPQRRVAQHSHAQLQVCKSHPPSRSWKGNEVTLCAQVLRLDSLLCVQPRRRADPRRRRVETTVTSLGAHLTFCGAVHAGVGTFETLSDYRIPLPQLGAILLYALLYIYA